LDRRNHLMGRNDFNRGNTSLVNYLHAGNGGWLLQGGIVLGWLRFLRPRASDRRKQQDKANQLKA